MSRPGLGAEPRPGVAEREIAAGTRQGLPAEPAVGRLPRPGAASLKAEIEQDRRGHDRHPRLAHREAAAHRGQALHDPAGGVEPEGRAARQHDRVDPRHQGGRVEQLGLAAARRPAAHIDRGDRRPLGQHHGRAGDRGGVLGLADQQPRHIGDQVARSGRGHGFSQPARDCFASPAMTAKKRSSLRAPRSNLVPQKGGRARMPTTVIKNAAWVVAWDEMAGRHAYRRDVDVAFTEDRITHVGPDYGGTADRTSTAAPAR